MDIVRRRLVAKETLSNLNNNDYVVILNSNSLINVFANKYQGMKEGMTWGHKNWNPETTWLA